MARPNNLKVRLATNVTLPSDWPIELGLGDDDYTGVNKLTLQQTDTGVFDTALLLERFPDLEYLDVQVTGQPELVLGLIDQMLQNRKITGLLVDLGDIDQTKLFKLLGRHHQVDTLWLDLHGANIAEVAEFLKTDRLKSLSLEGEHYYDISKLFRVLGQCRQLKVLKLDNWEITENAGPLPNVEQLELYSCTVCNSDYLRGIKAVTLEDSRFYDNRLSLVLRENLLAGTTTELVVLGWLNEFDVLGPYLHLLSKLTVGTKQPGVVSLTCAALQHPNTRLKSLELPHPFELDELVPAIRRSLLTELELDRAAWSPANAQLLDKALVFCGWRQSMIGLLLVRNRVSVRLPDELIRVIGTMI